jgi:ketosteroid isomerase-like protein
MTKDDEIQALIALEERRCRAEVESDVATLDSLLDDDFVYIHLSGGIDNKEKLLASRSTIKFPSMSRHDLRVHVSDDLAVIAGKISFQNKMVDSPVLRTVEAYVTQALARRGDQWKYIIHQVTLLKMTTEGGS